MDLLKMVPVSQRQPKSYSERALDNVHFDWPDTNEWVQSKCAEEDLYDPWTTMSLTIPMEDVRECDASAGKRKLDTNDDTAKSVMKKKEKINLTISEGVMSSLKKQPYIVGWKEMPGYNLTLVQYIESRLNSCCKKLVFKVQ